MYLTNSLHRCLQQTPDKIATIFRGRQRRYDEFCDRVARLAGALKAAGMKDNDRVGVLALNSDRYLEIIMAVWWGGGVLNPVNIRWSAPEVVYSLDDCDTGMLFIDDNQAGRDAALPRSRCGGDARQADRRSSRAGFRYAVD